jgi:hypothetical protein
MKGNPPFTRHEVKLEAITPRFAGLGEDLRKAKILWRSKPLKVLSTATGLWILIRLETGVSAAIWLVQEGSGGAQCSVRHSSGGCQVNFKGKLGRYRATVRVDDTAMPSLRATVSLRPAVPTRLAGLCRDVCLMDKELHPLEAGLLFTTQTKASAGQAFIAAGTATFFYFQNLGGLARYSALTGASLVSSVGVEWPLAGLKLPPGERPLPKGEEVGISDLFLRINPHSAENEASRAREFLDCLASVYRKIAPAPGPWHDWAGIATRTLKTLQRSSACVRKIKGRCYLNAYVGSDDKPPESMVQGAICVPLVEYEQWSGRSLPFARELAAGLASFRVKGLKTIARWLPGESFKKDEPSDEEQEEKMDSWYLLHTLMNLGRLAELGKDLEKNLFLESLDYAIRVAKHFDYDWPVFYHRKTLRVFRREKEDVPSVAGHPEPALPR